MLLKEWWAWWAALRGLHAQEMLDQRHLLVIADAGWKVDDREELVERWRKDAEGASGWLVHEVAPDTRDARPEIRGLFLWLRQKFWGDARQTTGFEEDQR